MVEKEIIIPELNNETIESMIYVVRDQKVMLDFELAKIYGYETKRFNEQVKNNINKLPERYRFQLIRDKVEDLVRCKNFTSRSWKNSNVGGRRYLPYVFTEQGMKWIQFWYHKMWFQLSKEETILIQRSKNLTAEIWYKGKGGRATLPYAFTEQGIYM